MQGLNKWLVSICVSVVILLVQVIVTQYSTISGLRTELSFAQSASRLSADQVSDLTYEIEKLRNEHDTVSTQHFIAGVVSAIERRDEFTAIWHAGYDRGTAVQSYVDNLDAAKTATYTDDKK